LNRPLFRPQALTLARTSAASVPAAPLSWKLLGGAIIAATASGILFVSTAEYARKETVPGALASAEAVARILPRRDGIVTNLKVREGSHVTAGQALFTIDSQQNLERGSSLDAALIENLDTQILLIQEQIDLEPTRSANELSRLEATIRNVKAQRESIISQRDIQLERLKASDERRQTLLQLYQSGAVTKAALQDQESLILTSRQNLADFERQLAGIERELTQAQLQLEQLPIQREERLSQLRLSLADRRRERVEIEGRRAQVVQAPISGYVTALQVSPGQIVDTSRPLLIIIPEKLELKAELFVPSRAIGFVSVGQRVRIMFDAFPYQRFGSYWGTVETVSQAVLSPNDLFGKVLLKEPAYRVTVGLDQQTVLAFGRQLPLQPDMGIRADIILESRSLIAWLFEPLLSLRGRL